MSNSTANTTVNTNANGKEKKEKVKFDKNSWQNGKQLFSYLKPYKWHFILGLIFLALGSAIFMILPVAAGELMNIIDGKSRWNLSLEEIGFIFFLVLVGQGICSYLKILFFTQISEKGLADIRKKLYEKLITQKVPYLEKLRVGELTSRSAGDVQQLQDTISVTFAEFLRQIISLVIGIGVIIWSAPKLTLLMLVTFPIVIICAIFFGKYIRKLSKDRQDEMAKANIILEETLQGVSVVKAFNNEVYETNRYNSALDKVVDISMRFARIKGVFIVFIITVLFGAMFFVLWSGAKMVQEGTMQSGDLITFITITAVIGGAMASIGDFYTQILKAIGASERIMEIIDSPTEMNLEQRQDPKALAKLQGNIAFKDVAFTYPSRKDVQIFENLNFNIKAGQKVAFVGGSGAGKSTIVQLILRFYTINKGQITVDGKSIYDYSLEQLRHNLAFVPQDIMLFGGSIRENIKYGNLEATEAQIIEAAKEANAWDFISSFPEGLDTLVGERGVKLSGGQRQRIAIARAILKNPNILLLDEATSALDANSEQVVQEALDRLMKGRTAIIIAHRLATIKEADKIFVLQKGQIVEMGTHNDLMNIEDGVYKQLAILQSTQKNLESENLDFEA